MHLVKNIITILSFLLIITVGNSVFAQEKQTIDGKEYIIHHVEQGTTLYSISKKYNVNVEDIEKENPQLKDGLKLGQELKIPVAKVQKQDAPQEKVIPEGFTKHEVQAGETLYAISKKYTIKVKEIIDNNPEVINGLKPGQILAIPPKRAEQLDIQKEVEKTEVKEIVGKEQKATSSGNYKIHEVKAGETLYALSRNYGVSTEVLIENNPELTNGLKLGQKLKIPVVGSEDVEEQIIAEIYTETELNIDTGATVLSDSIILQEYYNVALMLPFYLDMNDTIVKNQKGYEKETVYPKSNIALEFYQGALFALDSLKKMGVATKLYVTDTDNDSTVVKSFVSNKDSVNYSLIIGPLYKSNFQIASDYAKQNKISIVSPVPQSNKVLLGNEYVSKTSPSRHMQMEAIAEYVIPHYLNQNVFVVNTGEEDDKNLMAAFVRKAKLIEDTIKGLKDSLRIVTFGKLRSDKIKLHLDTAKENVIVIPSCDAVYVYDLLTLLNGLSEDYRITVFGCDKWLSFTNLDTDYLHNLKVHVSSPYFVDYEDIATKKFILKYRDKYFTEPSKYSFVGFDVVFHYVKLLDDYGVNMQSYLDKVNYKGLAHNFSFFKTGMESGYENKQCYIVKYEDFQLKKVN